MTFLFSKQQLQRDHVSLGINKVYLFLKPRVEVETFSNQAYKSMPDVMAFFVCRRMRHIHFGKIPL